ncbi:MAG: hypothetical protein ACI9LD_001997, partial [Polaromonas sp.]
MKIRSWNLQLEAPQEFLKEQNCRRNLLWPFLPAVDANLRNKQNHRKGQNFTQTSCYRSKV